MALAIGLGAFAAHGLKDKIDPYLLDVFNKAVKYHLIHALALVALPLVFKNHAISIDTVLYLQLAGVLLFSGSLYLLSTRFILGLDSWSWLGAITPLGGLMFIASWLILAYKLFKA